MTKPIIAPSILSADFAQLGTEVARVASGGADWIHVDVMDGHFVPNLTLGPDIVAAVRRSTSLPIDVHLMVTHPDTLLEDFVRAGANTVSVHAEACTHLQRTLARIKHLGASPAVALNPATPFESLSWVLDDLDMILVMTVNPGFGGQAFIPQTLRKVAELKSWLTRQNKSDIRIEVDGGVSAKTIQQLYQAGANTFVAGSAIFKAPDYAASMAQLRGLCQHA